MKLKTIVSTQWLSGREYNSDLHGTGISHSVVEWVVMLNCRVKLVYGLLLLHPDEVN